MKIIYLIPLLLVACTNIQPNLNIENAQNPQELYLTAKEAFKRSRYDLALQSLEKLDTNFPFSPFSDQVKLNLAYARFKSNKHIEAISSLDQYLQEKPYSLQAPYAWYLRGLCYQEWSIGYFTQQLGEADRSKYDLVSLKRAYANFEQIIKIFPKSIYSLDSAYRMKIIKEQLAIAEIQVAEYYLNRQAYIAAINRALHNLTVYQGATNNNRALELLIQGYLGLNRKKEAREAYRVLELNFPNYATLAELQKLTKLD
ncbi:MAG: outer membrane protein assembly factor BamD [Methylacidiphilales bacterium]|nr:outer membrane protein assembly factor BamD [Candidatus Methylacidiphilales bacterium]